MYLPSFTTGAALSCWRVFLQVLDHQVYKSFDQMENHLRSLENTPSTRFLARSQLSLLSSILSLLNPHAHLLLKSLEEGYWSGLRKSTKHSGRREDSRRRLTGVKPVGDLQPWGNLLPWEIFNLEETFRLEEFFKTSVLRKRTSDMITTHDKL